MARGHKRKTRRTSPRPTRDCAPSCTCHEGGGAGCGALTRAALAQNAHLLGHLLKRGRLGGGGLLGVAAPRATLPRVSCVVSATCVLGCVCARRSATRAGGTHAAAQTKKRGCATRKKEEKKNVYARSPHWATPSSHAAMKLDVNVLRHLSRDDFRTLTAVEQGQKNVRREDGGAAPISASRQETWRERRGGKTKKRNCAPHGSGRCWCRCDRRRCCMCCGEGERQGKKLEGGHHQNADDPRPKPRLLFPYSTKSCRCP